MSFIQVVTRKRYVHVPSLLDYSTFNLIAFANSIHYSWSAHCDHSIGFNNGIIKHVPTWKKKHKVVLTCEIWCT